MSFYIGQCYGSTNYWTPININDHMISNMSSPPSTAYSYNDTIIEVDLEKNQPYFLSIKIEETDVGIEQKADIKLYKDSANNKLDSNSQYIDTIIIPVHSETSDGYKVFNFLFTPQIDSCKKIAFILYRNSVLNQNQSTDPSKVKLDINNIYLFKLTNLIGHVNGVTTRSGNNALITQLGVHANPYTLMCINGEGIKIGKSGIFELNSTFGLKQQGVLDNNSDTIGINFLNIINWDMEKQKEIENNVYSIDYRYTIVNKGGTI